jgi:hypothetical protein
MWRQANAKSKFHSWEDDGDFVSSSNEMEETIVLFVLCAAPKKGRQSVTMRWISMLERAGKGWKGLERVGRGLYGVS